MIFAIRLQEEEYALLHAQTRVRRLEMSCSRMVVEGFVRELIELSISQVLPGDSSMRSWPLSENDLHTIEWQAKKYLKDKGILVEGIDFHCLSRLKEHLDYYQNEIVELSSDPIVTAEGMLASMKVVTSVRFKGSSSWANNRIGVRRLVKGVVQHELMCALVHRDAEFVRSHLSEWRGEVLEVLSEKLAHKGLELEMFSLFHLELESQPSLIPSPFYDYLKALTPCSSESSRSTDEGKELVEKCDENNNNDPLSEELGYPCG